jgi:hypothetical protein
MDTKLKKFLDKEKIKYKLVEHRKVYTAFNAAETQHASDKQVVKIVLGKLSKPTTHLVDGLDEKIVLNFVLVAIPAGKRVDLKKVTMVINDHQEKSYKIFKKADPKAKKPNKINVKLASEKDIEKHLKTKVGLLHPFGRVFGLPVLFDKKLAKNKTLVVSAGSYTESLEIKTKDYLKQSYGAQGNFTQ